jgi:hypothetical protein
MLRIMGFSFGPKNAYIATDLEIQLTLSRLTDLETETLTQNRLTDHEFKGLDNRS